MTDATMSRILRTALVLTASSATCASAQEPGLDPRWTAWIGCWQPVIAGQAPVPGALVCVVPAAGTGGVDLFSLVDGHVATTHRVGIGPEPEVLDVQGCRGWQRGEWSATGRRLYRSTDLMCAGVHRLGNELMAMVPGGEWLDIQSSGSDGHSAVRVLRYRPAPAGTAVPDTIKSLLPDHAMAIETARAAAAAALTVADIVEASRRLDTAVVAAWLAERGRPFALDAATLITLADSGVPGPVTDMMVALSFPQRFRLSAAQQDSTALGVRPAFLEPPPGGMTPTRDGSGYGGLDGYGYYGYGWGYYPYGYAGYGGYGPNRYYGGWYWNQPPVIIVAGGAASPQPHGRVVAGKGYQQGAGSSSSRSGGTRPPLETGSGSSSSSGSSGGSAVNSSGGSGSSTGTSTPASSGRTAHPRP
jgi:hypothetical protein